MVTVEERLRTWLGIQVWHLPEWFTIREIATSIQVSKSPTLLTHLNKMVEEGVLERYQFGTAKRPIWRYRITDNYRETVLEGLEREALAHAQS